MTFEKKHTRDFFFKYTSADTLKIILETEKIRYTNPKYFNDPFDVQSGLHLDIDFDKIEELIFNRIKDIVLSDHEPQLIENDPFNEPINYMRQKRATHGFPESSLKSLFKMVIKPLMPTFFATWIITKDETIKIRERMLMLCLTTKDDNILMWSHYADYHKGVVYKLKVAETIDEDDPLWLAQPVIYIPSAEPFYTTEKLIEEFIGLKDLSLIDVVKKDPYFKQDIWEYEDEWRFYDLNSTPIPHKDFGFKINKISEIIFGCKCEINNKKEIIDIVNKKNLKIDFFEMHKHPFDYKLIKKPMLELNV